MTTERKIWGGLKTQQVADLELSLGDVEAPVEAFEAPVAQVVDSIVDDGPERLSLFSDRIEEDRTANSERFNAFKSAVGNEISGRKWFLNVGLAILLGAAQRCARRRADAGLGHPAASTPSRRAGARREDRARRLRARERRRARARRIQPPPLAPALAGGQAEAERWDAFRRYLTDFPRLDMAPPATLELWERFLVYGIAFGLAERVLQGAQLHMPEALRRRARSTGSGRTATSGRDRPR